MHLVVPPGGSFRETRRIELGARELTIGRAESCEVRVDVPGVDDDHAKISAEALIAVGADCAVGDVPLDAGHRRLVMPGDEIQIGSVVVVLDGPLPVAQRRPGPRIRVVEGENAGAELVVLHENHEYVIGRSPKADLVLKDREVSREHLKIVRRGTSIFIYDQASTRGSWLGRSAVYQGSRIEWDRQRMLKVGATVLSLDFPEGMRMPAPNVAAGMPMTAPPRVHNPPPVAPVEAGPPENVVAYHYEAKPRTPRTEATMVMPNAPPLPPGWIPPNNAAPSSIPPSMPPSMHPRHSVATSRTAWKKTGPRIGRASGLLLLALAGLAIVGVLFVVFTLME